VRVGDIKIKRLPPHVQEAEKIVQKDFSLFILNWDYLIFFHVIFKYHAKRVARKVGM
jgi:hypothetical protein